MQSCILYLGWRLFLGWRDRRGNFSALLQQKALQLINYNAKKYQNKHSHTQKAFYYNFVYCLSMRLWAGNSPGSTLQCLCPTVVPQLNAESPASLCVFWLHAPLSSSAMVVKRVPSLPLSSSTSSPSGFSCSRVLLSCCMLWLARSDTNTNTNT